jgi:putative PEP-CTERM system histidine kinase
MKFTAASASRVEQADICRSLVRLIADMFQALSVAIWVVDEKKELLALSASTFLAEANAPSLNLDSPEGDQLMRHLKAHLDPLDFESAAAAWAGSLRKLHPSQFIHGGHRICVPLVAQGELIGLVTVGDRVGGAAFTLQDFDMLRCVGDHVTAGLRNVHLSQKLLQAKELEAFQTMATFFVHDLKNAASTLNLMLQNLPEHYDDPAFREDSLRGISKTVTHINRLIGRLSLLRHEQILLTVALDLNELVSGALVGLEQGVGALLAKDLRPVPKVMLDREQFAKVVTNLVLNAAEAVAQDGRVQITTSQEGSWVVLTVADNGCGMSAEFLSRGLFRPFQTTKKSGLGIGMFQSKMIVEAHGGRIAVSSEAGEGSTFQVFLPIPLPTR